MKQDWKDRRPFHGSSCGWICGPNTFSDVAPTYSPANAGFSKDVKNTISYNSCSLNYTKSVDNPFSRSVDVSGGTHQKFVIRDSRLLQIGSTALAVMNRIAPRHLICKEMSSVSTLSVLMVSPPPQHCLFDFWQWPCQTRALSRSLWCRLTD